MSSTRHVNTRQQANRQAFPELTPFVDALNAALMAHGAAPAKLTYLYRPGLEVGKPMDPDGFVLPTMFNGRLANGSEFARVCKANGK